MRINKPLLTVGAATVIGIGTLVYISRNKSHVEAPDLPQIKEISTEVRQQLFGKKLEEIIENPEREIPKIVIKEEPSSPKNYDANKDVKVENENKGLSDEVNLELSDGTRKRLEEYGEPVEMYYEQQRALKELGTYMGKSPAYAFSDLMSGASTWEEVKGLLYQRVVATKLKDLPSYTENQAKELLYEIMTDFNTHYNLLHSYHGLNITPADWSFRTQTERTKKELQLWKDLDARLESLLPGYENRLNALLGQLPNEQRYFSFAR